MRRWTDVLVVGLLAGGTSACFIPGADNEMACFWGGGRDCGRGHGPSPPERIVISPMMGTEMGVVVVSCSPLAAAGKIVLRLRPQVAGVSARPFLVAIPSDGTFADEVPEGDAGRAIIFSDLVALDVVLPVDSGRGYTIIAGTRDSDAGRFDFEIDATAPERAYCRIGEAGDDLDARAPVHDPLLIELVFRRNLLTRLARERDERQREEAAAAVRREELELESERDRRAWQREDLERREQQLDDMRRDLAREREELEREEREGRDAAAPRSP